MGTNGPEVRFKITFIYQLGIIPVAVLLVLRHYKLQHYDAFCVRCAARHKISTTSYFVIDVSVNISLSVSSMVCRVLSIR
jgi:hypothetical protein